MSEVLVGNEFEGKIGEVGSYVVDMDAKGFFKAELSAGADGALQAGAYLKGDLLMLLEKAAANTENKVDDAMVSMIRSALGR